MNGTLPQDTMIALMVGMAVVLLYVVVVGGQVRWH